MKNLGELLRESDPLRFEPSRSPEHREMLRRAVLKAAPSEYVTPRSRSLVAFAIIALMTLGGLFFGLNLRSLFVKEVQAAVRFEARLAETEAGPGLREAKVTDSDRIVYLHSEVIASNDDIRRAQVIPGADASHFGVAVEFTAAGAEKMRAATENRIGKLLAILLDGEVADALVIRTPVSAEGVISGNFTKSQAERIASGISVK